VSIYHLCIGKQENPRYTGILSKPDILSGALMSGLEGFYCIYNGYCISNAVDYAKKNDVLPTISQLN